VLVGHFSDLHGDWGPLYACKVRPDLWICSGDHLPNKTRGNIEVEVPYQTQYAISNLSWLKNIINDTPVLWCPGNHDFINLATVYKDHMNIHDITTVPLQIGDRTFYGAREINYIAGEWAGETDDFQPIVDRFLLHNPDVLITHAPPAGVLDRSPYSRQGYGVTKYASYFAYQDHKVKHWFFGHVHEAADYKIKIDNTTFYNGACALRFHNLD